MGMAARMAHLGAINAGRQQTVSFADNFNRANSSSLGSNWAEYDGGGLSISSNLLQGGSGSALWETDCLTDSQFSQASIGPDRVGIILLAVRAGTSGWPVVWGSVSPSTGQWWIYTDPSNASGNTVTRASGTTSTSAMATGLPVRIEAIGSVYTLKLDGAPIPDATWTDSGNVHVPGPTRRRVGIRLQDCNVDEWVGGDL